LKHDKEAMTNMKSNPGLRFRSRLIGALVVGFVALSGMAGLTAPPKDVPAGHVASESVALLISKGYLPLYDDGTFKGNNMVDRYNLAMVVARLLKDIDAGKVKVSDEDLKLVQKLSTEFREELVAQGVEVDKFRADFALLKSDLAAKQALSAKTDLQLSQDIAGVAKRASQAVESASSLDQRLVALDAKVSKGISGGDTKDLQAKVDALEKDLAAVKQKAASDASYLKTLALLSALAGVIVSILVGTTK